MKKILSLPACLGLALSLLMLIGAATAVSVTVTPDHVNPGDEITVNIQDLPDGANCALTLQGVLDIPAGSSAFVFDTGKIMMPFALSPGSFVITNMNTVNNKISLTDYEDVVGEAEVEVGEPIEHVYLSGTSVNGVFTKTLPFNNREVGSFQVRDEGTVTPGITQVTISSQITGTKTGPEDSVITFTLGDTNSGELTVLVTVNGTTVLSKEITVTGNQETVQTGPVFDSNGFLVTPGKSSAFVASANPFFSVMNPGTVTSPGSVMGFFSPTPWGPLRWDRFWQAAFSV